MNAAATLNSARNQRGYTSGGPTVRNVPRVRATEKPPANPEFGTYLTTLMSSRGLDNSALGALADVSDSTISRWRTGTDVPSERTLRKVAPHLGVRHGDLLIKAGHSTPEELGTVGAPPPPGGPLPTILRKVVALLLDTRVSQHEKEVLLGGIKRTVDLWEEMRNVPREPRMR